MLERAAGGWGEIGSWATRGVAAGSSGGEERRGAGRGGEGRGGNPHVDD